MYGGSIPFVCKRPDDVYHCSSYANVRQHQIIFIWIWGMKIILIRDSYFSFLALSSLRWFHFGRNAWVVIDTLCQTKAICQPVAVTSARVLGNHVGNDIGGDSWKETYLRSINTIAAIFNELTCGRHAISIQRHICVEDESLAHSLQIIIMIPLNYKNSVSASAAINIRSQAETATRHSCKA